MVRQYLPVLLALLTLFPAVQAETTTVPRLDQPYKHDPWRRDDGSYRYALKIDGGIAKPAGSTRQYQNLAGGFGFGAGYNLNKHAGAMLEYSFNDFGVPKAYLTYLLGTPPVAFGGRVHIWSITLNPTWNVYQGEATGAYLIGGGGFFRKQVIFGTPIVHCPGGDTATCTGGPPSTSSRYSNNAGGLDVGAGLTHRLTLNSKVRAFAEARYTWVDNHSGPGDGSYAPAYDRTGYFPIVVGLKW